MSYVTLTEDHIMARMSASERGSIEDAGQEGAFQPRIPGIIEQITSFVRSKVATCRQNILGPSGTIPDECLYHAVTLARHALIASLPVAPGELDPRQKEYDAANAFFDKVASCDVTITNPDGISANAGGIQWGSEPKYCF